LTRLQRASEGSGESTRCGGNNVIQGSGVGLQDCGWNLVVLSHRAMHAEYYGLGFRRKIRSAHGALNALNAHVRTINHLGHNDRMVARKGASATGLLTWRYHRAFADRHDG